MTLDEALNYASKTKDTKSSWQIYTWMANK